MSRVTVKAGGKIYETDAPVGQTVRALLSSLGLSVESPCGGQGRCGKCLCTLTGEASARGRVLACRTRILGDCEILLEDRPSLCTETDRGEALPADGGYPPGSVGFGVDLGTTTLAVGMYDLNTGQRLAAAGGENPQRALGGDVMTRIGACMEDPAAEKEMTASVRAAVGRLCLELLRQTKNAPVGRMAVCGNTVMLHLFAGLSPVSMGTAPYTPLTLFDTEYPGGSLGLPFDVPVWLLPCVGPFIGADCTAGMLATGFDTREVPLFLGDVGTNGELMLKVGNQILCTSAAAGPAFEGAGISCGTCALPGAVYRVELKDGQTALSTLGNAPARGICGPGLVSLLSELLRQGLVDETGRLLSPGECPSPYGRYLSEKNGGRFDLAPGVYLTGEDVRALQLAKAALCAAAEVLLLTGGVTPESLTRVYLSGGFGSATELRAAETVGLFPPALLQRAEPAGNTAARGCAMALLSSDARRRLSRLAASARELSLSAVPEFSRRFVEHISF